jgi:hypothetical protein
MKDCYNIIRAAGSEWLIGIEQTEIHLLDVNEEFVRDVNIISLSTR